MILRVDNLFINKFFSQLSDFIAQKKTDISSSVIKGGVKAIF